MIVTIDLPPELEQILRQQAARRGQDLSDFVLQAVEEKLAKARTLDEICSFLEESRERAWSEQQGRKPPVGDVPAKFRVGDRVRVRHGFRGVVGEVVEDRGPIGVGGRRLYAVKMRLDEWNEHTTELPEESLEPAEPEAHPRRDANE